MTIAGDTITGFKVEGRRNPRLTVFLAGEAWATLDAETVIRENLKAGQRLDAARRQAVLETDEVVRARKTAAAHNARAPHSIRETERFLKDRGFSDRAAAAALESLVASGTLDDARLAERVLRAARCKKFGPLRIEAEFHQRGLDAPDLRRRLGEALRGDPPLEDCVAVARQAARRYRPISDPRQRRKLAQFLARRGFPAEIVRQALERLGAVDDADAP